MSRESFFHTGFLMKTFEDVFAGDYYYLHRRCVLSILLILYLRPGRMDSKISRVVVGNAFLGGRAGNAIRRFFVFGDNDFGGGGKTNIWR